MSWINKNGGGTAGGGSLELSTQGELITAQNRVYIQSAPVNNYTPANFRNYTAAGGSASVVDKEFTTQTNNSLYGYGAIQSFRSIAYKAGLTGVCRFCCRFPDSGVAGFWQGVGMISVGDEISFGYNGADFGIWHRHNGLAEVQELYITTAAGGAENATVDINGSGYVIPVTAGTVQHNAWEIADYLDTNVAGFQYYQVDSGIYVIAESDGAKGSFAITSDGNLDGSWFEKTTGVTKTSDHVASGDWNGEVFAGFDPTTGNAYEVEYQYGYGVLVYKVFNPNTTTYDVAHTVRHASNNKTQPIFSNPSMRAGLYCASVGGTQNVTVKCSDISIYVQGDVYRTRNPRAFANNKSVSATLTNILSIRNRGVVNGYVNQVEIQPLQLTVFTESNKGAEFQIIGNATVAGDRNWQNVGSQNLVSDYDTTGGTVTEGNGRLLGSYQIAGNSTAVLDLSSLLIRVPPTLELTIAAKVNSGAAADTGAAIVWYEDV